MPRRDAVEPTDALTTKIDAMRETAAFDALPAEYRAIEQSPDGHARAARGAARRPARRSAQRAPRAGTPVVMTDVRGQLGHAVDSVA